LITIHSAMLVLLGFFGAALLAFLIAPAYRRRAERLATDELKGSMPLTTSEIRADKDRLRAEFAISIHKLEAKLEHANIAAARQMVEINRRDAAISTLEGEVARMRTFLDEHENARRVLEQTITERLPRVELRLAEARKLLGQRDRELGELTSSASKHSAALEEATQINAQQRDEIHRLNATLTMHAARNRESLMDPRFDAEVSLRTEIEALRAKAREQTALISRLQGALAKSGIELDQAGVASGLGVYAKDGRVGGQEAELARLRKDLAEAELALRSVKSSGEGVSSHAEAELRSLRALSQDQQAEIANLKAALQAYEAGSADDRAIKESKIALKARLSALQAQADEQTATIQTLRAEVAAANEKLARQAAHFMDEMRRLGAGTLPASGPMRRSGYDGAKRVSLSERISAPRPVRSERSGAAMTGGGEGGEVEALSPVTELDRTDAQSWARQAHTDIDSAASKSSAASVAQVSNGSAGGQSSSPEDDAAVKPARRLGLLERITGLEKQA
jgi:hypothetical protein